MVGIKWSFLLTFAILFIGCQGQPLEEFLADEEFPPITKSEEAEIMEVTRSSADLAVQLESISAGRKNSVGPHLRNLLHCTAQKKSSRQEKVVVFEGHLCPVKYTQSKIIRGTREYLEEYFMVTSASDLKDFDLSSYEMKGHKLTSGRVNSEYEGKIQSKKSGTILIKVKATSQISGQYVNRLNYYAYYFKDFKVLAKIDEVYFQNGALLQRKYFLNREELSEVKFKSLFPNLF